MTPTVNSGSVLMGYKWNRVNTYILSDVLNMKLTLSKVAFLVFGNDKNKYSERANFCRNFTIDLKIKNFNLKTWAATSTLLVRKNKSIRTYFGSQCFASLLDLWTNQTTLKLNFEAVC